MCIRDRNITISELNALIEQIIQYDKVNEEKQNTEKKLRQFLGDIANKDMSNLQEIKLGIEAVDALKAMFDKVPDEVRNMMSAPDHPLKLEYSEESTRNIVEDLCGKLSGVDIASIRCCLLYTSPETIRKWHMKQRIFLLTLLFLLILTRTNDISAKETKLNEDMFTNVENTLKDKEIDLSYTQLVKQLIHGNVKGVLHTINAKMKEGFLNRMLIQKDLIREILLIAFTAAIFKNLSDSFFQQSTANSAFYITYVILCGVMVHSFFYLNKTVTQLVTLMADYMKGMIMAYSLAVVSTSGITTSTTVYEFYLLLIYAMTTLTNVILLPMIKILFVLKIINHISKEEHFSRLCKTLEGVITVSYTHL